MSLAKELIEQERQLVQAGRVREVHLHKEGTFLQAYDWSAWLCCRYLHDFKVNFHLSYEQLLADLHQAYYDARRHKRQKPYQQHWPARQAQVCALSWKSRITTKL